MPKMRHLNLLKDSTSLIQMLEQLSRGLSKSDISCAEVAWDGYIQNLELIKAKVIEAVSILEAEENLPSSANVSIRLNRESELSPSLAKRIRRAPEGRVREVPLTNVESLEGLDEDRMVMDR